MKKTLALLVTAASLQACAGWEKIGPSDPSATAASERPADWEPAPPPEIIDCVPFGWQEEVPGALSVRKGPGEIPQRPPTGVPMDCPPPMGPWADYRGRDAEGKHPGGCSAWATALCNRRLSRDPAYKAADLSKDELDCLGAKIGTDPLTGGTPVSSIARYYRDKGCAVENKYYGEKTSSSETNFTELKAKLDAGCDIKLIFTNGSKWAHIETVTGVTADGCVETDSWGRAAKMCGSNAGGGPTFGGSSVGRLQQPGWAISVRVMYVCCP